MSSRITMYGTTNESAQTTLDNMRLANVSLANAFRNLSTYFMRPALGSSNLNWTVQTGAVRATGLITFTGRPTADETLTVCNVTLTAKDSGGNGTTQFNTSGSDVGVTAANCAACINANTTINKIVSATSLLGVVTITALVPGALGNGLDLTESMTNTAKTAFASGSNGTSINIAKGI